MASAAEQLAQNFSIETLSKAKELKSRIFFTLAALIIYRFGTYIPLPGIDTGIMAEFFHRNSSGILGMFDMLSGGALSRMTIFALNIMPYISASIIVQLMSVVSPQIEQLKKEGEAGRRKMNQYTRYLTIILAALQAYGISAGLERMSSGGAMVVLDPGFVFRVTTIVTLVAGTMFLMWLGDQITNRGIGNGVSMIIFAGIVANLPRGVAQLLELGRTGALSSGIIMLIIIMVLAVVTFIVFMERAQRKLIVQYPKRQVGSQRMVGGTSSHMPLKLNTAGVIPPIFASSLLLMPITVANFTAGSGPAWLEDLTRMLGHGKPLYIVAYSALIIFFCFFYTAVVFNPADTAENLRKYGGIVPGIRPGKNTAEYFDFVLTRLTVLGSLYLTAVCVFPELIISKVSVPFYFGGTSLLIVVSVTMDTVTQVHSHLLAQQYDGLIKKARLSQKR